MFAGGGRGTGRNMGMGERSNGGQGVEATARAGPTCSRCSAAARSHAGLSWGTAQWLHCAIRDGWGKDSMKVGVY